MNILLLMLLASVAFARHHPGGLHVKALHIAPPPKVHIISPKEFGKDMLVGKHVFDMALESGALGPEGKALGQASKLAEIGIKGAVEHKSAAEIGKEMVKSGLGPAGAVVKK